MAYNYGNYRDGRVEDQYEPRRPQENNSTLYLIGKVALFALSWYGTIVLESPVLAVVTVGIGVSLLYDVFSRAMGGGQPPAGRGGNGGYRGHNVAGQQSGPVDRGYNNSNRFQELPNFRLDEFFDSNPTRRESVGNRDDQDPNSLLSMLPRSNKRSDRRRTDLGRNNNVASTPAIVVPSIDRNPLQSGLMSLGDRNDDDHLSEFSILTNEDVTLPNGGRVELGERNEKKSFPSSSIPNISNDRDLELGGRRLETGSISMNPLQDRAPVGTRSSANEPLSRVFGLNPSRPNTLAVPKTAANHAPIGDRPNKPED